MQARNTQYVLIVGALSLIAAQSALAQGVGNLNSLPSVIPMSGSSPGWVVGAPTNPIPVVRDPLGPQWGKSFTDPNGGSFSYAPTSPTNPPLSVQEFLVVDPKSPPWTDWHEEVIGIDALTGASDYGWTWVNPALLVNGLPAPGLTTSIVGNTVSFFFNPVLPGDTVTIRKQLAYNGVPGAVFNGTLAVHEYPTPEPASMALMGLGSALLLRRRQRRAAS